MDRDKAISLLTPEQLRIWEKATVRGMNARADKWLASTVQDNTADESIAPAVAVAQTVPEVSYSEEEAPTNVALQDVGYETEKERLALEGRDATKAFTSPDSFFAKEDV